MVKPPTFRWLIQRGQLIVVGWLLIWMISACSNKVGTPAELTPTAEPILTAPLTLSSGPMTTVESSDHTHPLNAPEHIHLDDGSVLTTGGLPLEDELLVQLLAGEPLAVGPANASAQTVALTVPTMFWIACEARVVSNLRELSGIVSLEANSEASELLVTYNTDTLTIEDITAQIALTGDEVTAWEMKNWAA